MRFLSLKSPWFSGCSTERLMVLQVKRQQENLVPRPEPINIPSRAALSLLSEQHMHELWWQPCWQTEINSSIVSAAWQHKAVPHKRCFLTDCFGATTRKTQNKNNIYSTGGENIFVRSPTFPLLQFPYWSVEEGGGDFCVLPPKRSRPTNVELRGPRLRCCRWLCWLVQSFSEVP